MRLELVVHFNKDLENSVALEGGLDYKLIIEGLENGVDFEYQTLRVEGNRLFISI